MIRLIALVAAMLSPLTAMAQEYAFTEYTSSGVPWLIKSGHTSSLLITDQKIARAKTGPKLVFSCFNVDLKASNARQLRYDSSKGNIINGPFDPDHSVPGLDCYKFEDILAAHRAKKLVVSLLSLKPEGYNKFMGVDMENGRGWIWTQNATCTSWEPDCGRIAQDQK